MLKSLIYLTLSILISATTTLAANSGQSAYQFALNQASKTNPLFGYIVGPGTERLDKPVLRPFSTDGCSQSPNGFRGYDFVECCVAHDVSYWIGGTLETKVQADKDLASCIESRANKTISEIYLKGVSMGGGARGINTFRWGYGWDRVRAYSPLTTSEIQQAETMYGKNLIKLQDIIKNKTYKINFELLTLDMLTLNRTFDDELIYYYLQNHLTHSDQISFGQKLYLDDWTFYYRIRLKSCGESPVDFKIAHWNGWKKFVYDNVSIHSLSWSELSTYITSVRDPGGCLK